MGFLDTQGIPVRLAVRKEIADTRAIPGLAVPASLVTAVSLVFRATPALPGRMEPSELMGHLDLAVTLVNQDSLAILDRQDSQVTQELVVQGSLVIRGHPASQVILVSLDILVTQDQQVLMGLLELMELQDSQATPVNLASQAILVLERLVSLVIAVLQDLAATLDLQGSLAILDRAVSAVTPAFRVSAAILVFLGFLGTQANQDLAVLMGPARLAHQDFLGIAVDLGSLDTLVFQGILVTAAPADIRGTRALPHRRSVSPSPVRSRQAQRASTGSTAQQP